ncbi:hypothetical protein EPD65_14595 [Nocardioides jejuensis]|uniref:Uncharacterized protein n=1 Tax=Nocardioides jejuensis TaxID=2502782 RepID=A0A4R1BUP8_9ACTN|nr:hypothetical protein EPD65_14595 [Nocardioides jejuensis]
MASPPKNDAWGPYAAHEQRFVFIKRAGALKPYLGYVVEWPLTANSNRFLVAFVEDGVRRTFRMEWFERRLLVPVEVDPNASTRRPGGPSSVALGAPPL